MYESPIKIFLSEMHAEQEGMIMRAVQKMHVEVNKEDLLAALAYDRQQYYRGYEDGMKAAMEQMEQTKKAENCRYYTPNSFWGAGCLGSKEIDPCEGDKCERWKPKEG